MQHHAPRNPLLRLDLCRNSIHKIRSPRFIIDLCQRPGGDQSCDASQMKIFALLLSLLSQSTATDRVGLSGTGQDGTTWAATAMRDGTGGRRAGGGGRRREEGGLAGNMGAAEAEGQVTKGCEWELRGADSDGRRGQWAGEQARAEAGQHGCCPASALAIWSRHGQFPP